MRFTRFKEDKWIYKKAFILALPMIIQNGISNAVMLVDNVMVGSLGTEAITAVSIGGQLIFVYSLAIFGGLSGPGIYVAQYYGNGDTEGVKKVFRVKILIAITILILGILTFTFFDGFLIDSYMKGGSETIDSALTHRLAVEYLFYMTLGIIPFSLSQIYSTHLRETGDSFRPMVAGICSVVTDIALNYILIFGKMGLPAMGVKGAAIATALSRVVELLVIVIWAHKRKDIHTFLVGIYSKITVPMEFAKPIIIKGIPIFFNELLWAASIAALTQCYSMRGLDIVAAFNISNALCNLFNVVFVSLGVAIGIIVGQMLGASQFERAKYASKKLIWFSAYVPVVITLVLCALAPFFPNIYNTTDSVREMAMIFIIITALFFPLQGVINALYFIIRSGGKTFITFLFDSVFSWVVSVLAANILVRGTDFNIYTIIIIVYALDLIKAVIGYILFNKGIWITNLVDDGTDTSENPI